MRKADIFSRALKKKALIETKSSQKDYSLGYGIIYFLPKFSCLMLEGSLFLFGFWRVVAAAEPIFTTSSSISVIHPLRASTDGRLFHLALHS